jgi:hypothetical protein
MNNWTITTGDDNVIKDGIVISGLSMAAAPANVHALQWCTANSTGWIELKDPNTGMITGNKSITVLPPWANTIFAEYDAALAAQQAAEAAASTTTTP